MKKVILDVDTGVDDALGILLALKSPELKLEGITTVVGNVSVTKTTKNTLKILELAGARDVPVAKGSKKPLSKRIPEPILINGKILSGYSYWHGKDGLANTKLSPPTIKPYPKPAEDFLIEKIKSCKEKITLITTGPLTNIAKAILKDPSIVEMVDEHFLMGGCYEVSPYACGNVSPVAEFNIWFDPNAAKIVFNSGLKIIAVGLDVAHDPSTWLKPNFLEKFQKSRTQIKELILKLCKYIVEVWNGPLYDPLTVAIAIDRSIASMKKLPVQVVTKGKFVRGMTIADKRSSWERELRLEERWPEIDVCYKVDGKKFLDLFIERLNLY